MTNQLRYLLIVFLLQFLLSCYPQGAEYTDELDLVYTNYDPETDFSAKRTYAIPDSVIKITGDNFEDPDGDGKPQFVKATYSAVILTQIKKDMELLGWVLVDKNDDPDVVILVSSNTTTNLYYYYDWSYWGWYYPGYNPGWGWYYPGWYYPPYVTGYRSGSIFIQMVDNIDAADGENIPVIWSCIVNGLAEGSTADITTRTQINIDKAFSQSPYLKH
jgi:hypothetical protein